MAKQQEIAGFEAPKNTDIENAIDMWLDAKEEQKRSTETTKLRHATLLLHMQNAGLDVYPFTCPKTGKKKQVVIARDPKAKTLKQARWNRRDNDGESGDDIEVRDAEAPIGMDDTPPDNVVEMRRVKRTAEHDAIVDPFAATRGAMEDVKDHGAVGDADTDDTEAVHDAIDAAAKKPKKGKAKR